MISCEKEVMAFEVENMMMTLLYLLILSKL